MAKPSRSDEHLSPSEESKREQSVKTYFNSLDPKRHAKPMRSDYSTQYVDFCDVHDDTIPENTKLQDLEKTSQKLTFSMSDSMEEYVETEYYKDLNCVDKQHHTTGTGFIKVNNTNGGSLSFSHLSKVSAPASLKGNPATNEWIPVANTVIAASRKPNRSEI